jgi:hypothetical protein
MKAAAIIQRTFISNERTLLRNFCEIVDRGTHHHFSIGIEAAAVTGAIP